MRQALHIFQKDARRCWPYIAITLVLTAALAVVLPKTSPIFTPATTTPNNAAKLLELLLPVAWWLTIARVVHGESLVGSRQFWATRPYSWRSLLAAKLLFCLAFLIVPKLVCDAAILAADGLDLRPILAALLWRECVVAAFLLLPAFVLAVLTAATRQFVMGTFIIFLAFFALARVQLHSAVNLATTVLANPAKAQLDEWLWTALYLAFVAGLVVWQYATRRTAGARAFAVGICAVVFLSSAFLRNADAIAPREPAPPVTQFPEIALRFAPERGRFTAREDTPPGKVIMDLPIEFTGRERELLHPQLAGISLRTKHVPEAPPWHWRNEVVTREGADWLHIEIDRDRFEKMGPVAALDVLIGVTVYEPAATATVIAGAGWTTVEGLGQLSLPQGSTFLWARTPLREPAVKIVSSIPGRVSVEWTGSYPSVSGFPGIDPVASSVVLAAPDTGAVKPGTPVDIRIHRPLAYVARDLHIEDIRLDDYVVR